MNVILNYEPEFDVSKVRRTFISIENMDPIR
jgi:hypothetical protein